MHLVEQLRSKQTQAHDHLLSRKRKLAELFAITACTGDFYNAPPSQHYLQRLQAFQDANDLQNGRRFDESTLPLRPQINFQPRHSSPLPPVSDSLKASRNLGVSKSTSSRRASPARITVGEQANDVPGRPGSPNGQDARRNEISVSGPSAEHGKTVLHDSADEAPVSKSESAGAHLGSLSSDELHSHENVLSDSKSKHTKSATNIQKRETTEDVQLVVSRTANHPPSSPATSDEPFSNTPVPTTGSPTTSPGEESSPLKIVAPEARKPIDQNVANPQTQPSDEDAHSPLHKLSVTSADLDMIDADPTIAFESHMPLPPPQIHVQREATSRPRPEIRVNTQHSLGPLFRPQAITSGAFVETPAQMTAIDTSQQSSTITPVSTFDSLKRATRISSGALQKKSVSEILGETPKSSSPHTDSPMASSGRDPSSSLNLQAKQADKERKEKERSKLSTVVFAKPQRPVIDVEATDALSSLNRDVDKGKPEDRDYLYTLFESKAYSSKQGNLGHLIQHAHKTITTADHLVDYEYQAQCRVLKRLYQLQSAERWALRQRKRADEPPRQTSHWDFLLDHVRWMRTDFREERKWKLAAARGLAECCAEWVASSPEQRKLLQVQVRPTRGRGRQDDASDTTMDEVLLESSHPTPDLLPSGEDDSVSEDIADPRDITLSAAPAAIFSLGASDFTFVADRTPAFDKLINELPLYEPARIEPDLAKSNLAAKLDGRWMTDIVPISKYATEKLKVKEFKPPFKRSRYDYSIDSSSSAKVDPMPPRDRNVGLFMPENKHIRDRIHPGHSFRPPSEYNMPTQAFFETRTSSQWTPAEDDELRKLVKDYSYNWSLISSCLTPRSLYTSSPDRRTPWECFERWIGLEGMPADMAKTPYFRTYSGRIDAASRHIQEQIEEAQRRAGPNVPISTRKRTTQPVRVEKKRAQRHLAMLDAMRKLAKKRETMRQKQSHSAEVAAMRKATEVNHHNKPPLRTPAEFSALKHEREQKMAKQQEIYRQQLIAHQRAASAQQQRAPNGQVNGVPNGVPQAAGAGRGVSNGVAGPVPNGHLQVPNGVPRPHPAMLGPNGMPIPASMAGPKAIQAQLQANMRGGMNGSPQQIRMQQEQLIRQAQQNGTHSSPNPAHANTTNGHNAGFLLDTNSANGQPSPSGVSGTAGSPRQPGNMGQALSSGHIPVLTQIAANIKQRHPNMSDDEIQRAASQQLTTWQQQATAAAAGQSQRPRVNQAALNAAMGAANAAAHAGNVAAAAAAANGVYTQGQSMLTSEQMQQYNQRMRLQQAQQQVARGMAGQIPAVDQMANSPVMNMSRPASQHLHQPGISRSATPSQKSGTMTNTSVVHSNGPSTPGGSMQQQVAVPSQGSPARPPSQQQTI